MLLTALLLVSALRVDAPIVLTAQSPASAQDTSLVPWVGPRVGLYFDDDNVDGHDEAGLDGVFTGVEAQALLGLDSQGTDEVAVTRLPLLLEARAVTGTAWRQGLVSIAGYGFGGAGVGGGGALFKAFDEQRLRFFGLWVVRGGAGVEFAFLNAFTRVEAGVGVRDLRLELSGSFAIGGRF